MSSLDSRILKGQLKNDDGGGCLLLCSAHDTIERRYHSITRRSSSQDGLSISIHRPRRQFSMFQPCRPKFSNTSLIASQQLVTPAIEALKKHTKNKSMQFRSKSNPSSNNICNWQQYLQQYQLQQRGTDRQ